MSGSTSTPKGMLTRKQFLRAFTALGGLAVAHSTGIISAGRAFAQQTVAGEPVRGGVLALNLTGDPPHFDPLSGTSTTIMNVIAPCYNGLARFDPYDPLKIIPDLAASWDIAEDSKTYTFHLVENVKFHDGKPMTSADVKYSFDLMRNPPEGTISARKNLMAVVDTIDAVDDHTVRFNLKQPSPSFLSSIADCWSLIMPKHILETKGNMKTDIVGTGPFKLQVYNRGTSVELVRNENYHVKGLPFLDGVTCFIIPDSGTTWNYLQSGQLHWFVSIQGQDAGAYKSDGDLIIEEAPSTSFIAAVFNTKKPPFDNKILRKALSVAIDRNAALKITYNGQGQLGGISVPGPWELPAERLNKISGYEADGNANLEQAKRLLAEAGHPDGLSVQMLVRKNPLFEPVGVFLKDQWEKIGVKVTIDIQENAAYADKLNKGDYNVTASGGSYSIVDPDFVFSQHVCDGGNNITGTCSPQIDDLFDKQTVTSDPTERKKVVNEMEELVAEEHAVYVMYWRNRFMGFNKAVNGLKIHPNVDQNMRLEAVWLSA
ncbi:ABC transporter substrate-binding protein [Ensifer sp. ENS05]|uniref:ABC transporter substrate-binding protein n=1 Tax=Ensifer sp. ENS05 TaxID=2769277 RepID=UPI00178090C0|nr:ABC transporter substrate-binding protein [Ensifer sp. ENS05]MBD9596399.1 ABC transporter substrate-binding protein [Ensifer sp. ENS05]